MFNLRVRKFVEFIKNIPGVMRIALFFERNLPNAWSIVLGAVSPVEPVITYTYEDLPPRAKRIYDELKIAVQKKKGSA